MDKNNNRKVRMAGSLQLADNAAMDEQIYVDMALRDEAADLANRAFDDPSDDHIECIHARLAINRLWGLSNAGAVTVH